ncbi:MAG TPA: hypothetical protein DCY79_02530 [Planctomycetaceae bacterium]|nr:hypothetical protein [Blastopirellula sp.]HAY78666.1 hypothetical protein [Planctomycetaceae bacterium]
MNQLRIMILLLAAACTPPLAAEQLLYLASSEGKSITGFAVHPQTGDLSKRFQVDLPGNTGPLAFSPQRDFVYAAVNGLPDRQTGVVTLRRSADGTLKMAGNAVPITSRTAYIRTDRSGKFLLAAHYGDGDVTVYQIDNGQCTGKLIAQQATARTAHCIELDPSGKYVFVPHTAPNRVFQFTLGADGKLTPNQPPYASGPDADHRYHGPRHYAHHPRLPMAFTSNETGGGISSWKFDSRSGTLQLQQTLCTLPPGYEGGSAAADIKLTPDGRYAYVSNRDTRKSPEHADTLAVITIDPATGAMEIVGHQATAHFPRSICIDVHGHYLFAAGQRDATLHSYRISAENGKLVPLKTYPTAGGPIWVMCAE